MLDGFIYNNLGISHFYKFIELSQKVQNPQDISADSVGPIIDSMNNSVSYLKQSVRAMEDFDVRLKELQEQQGEEEKGQDQQEVRMIDIETKLFVDEFFDPKVYSPLPPDFKQYDVLHNARNEQFLRKVFTNPPVILPIQNLGEIAFILQKTKEAFALLDISIKLYKNLDPDNLLKYKNLALLGALLESQGQTQLMQNIY